MDIAALDLSLSLSVCFADTVPLPLHCPDTPREDIYVHVQLLMSLATESGEIRRRRMLLSTEGAAANQFKSYVGTATVQEALSPLAQLEMLDDGDLANQWWFWLLSFLSVVIIAGFVGFKLTQKKGVAVIEVFDESAADVVDDDVIENEPFVQNDGV